MNSIEQQLALPSNDEIIPEGLPLSIEPTDRLSLHSLCKVLSEQLPATTDITATELVFARSASQALYVHPTSPQFYELPNIIRHGVQTPNQGRFTRDYGIVFPQDECNIANIQIDEVPRIIMPGKGVDMSDQKTKIRRQVGALTTKVHEQKKLTADLVAERRMFVKLYRDVRDPKRTRYMAKNIDAYRACAEERIHQVADVAAGTLDIDSTALLGIHKAIRMDLYDGNYSQAQFGASWMQYLAAIGLYTKARIEKLTLAQQICERYIHSYQPLVSAETQ